MTFVVTEACVRCKYTDCVEVCPVDCFHEGAHMLVINPEECIDCHLCVPECPVDAIYADNEVPEPMQSYIALNEKLAQLWPVLNHQRAAPEDAAHWETVKDKKEFAAIPLDE